VPTYQYACTECDAQLEVRQSFTDDALTTCPSCEGRLRKIFNAVGVVFKGSGFYRTDSRKTPDSSGGTDGGTDGGSSGGSSGGADSGGSSDGGSSGSTKESSSPAPASAGASGSAGEKKSGGASAA
jgi:putative FmdB family regulatory protein